MKRFKSWLLTAVLLCPAFSAWSASSTSAADTTDTTHSTINTSPVCTTVPTTINYPWSILFYRGVTSENTLGQLFGLKYNPGDEKIYSLELARELSPNNPIRHYLQPLVSTVELAGNVAYRDDVNKSIYEFDPYLIFRWQNFPWHKYLQNSLGMGWGVSYVSSVPSWEQQDSENTKKLLNYLMFEATFALPQYPQWELVLRLHHRSGAFGLYGADNAGSTAVGIGIRYRF